MKWLVLGGTKFLGRAFVEEALAAGHEVTLFNRGKTGPDLFPGVETITGDRTNVEDLAKLAGRKWDAVLDPSGYVPRIVRMSAEQLKDSADYYVYVSSISAYRDHSNPKQDESYPVGTIEDTTIEEITGESYGPLKALSEQAVEEVFPGKSLHVRAGLIIGPYDPTDRFTYWPARIQKGGEFVAPEGPDQRMQFIDARDIAQWVLRMAEKRKGGVYNVTGEPKQLNEIFDTITSVTGTNATPVYVDAAFLEAKEVQPWQEMTMWIPASDEKFRGMNDTSVEKAKADGLTTRPLKDTVRDLLAWHNTRDLSTPSAFGLPADKEQSVLEAWRSRENAE
jgi:2'-hydroxyisoflavone reductase